MQKIIVSFTSYPARIQYVSTVLDCLIKQTVLPDKILLYLSSGQFKDYAGFPDFTTYKKYGLEVCWNEEDIGPHKKYFYAMQEYPEDIIITVDDDIRYKDTMIENLLFYHKEYPNAVIARRGHLVTVTKEERIAPYKEWYGECKKFFGIPRMDVVATGCGGVLYPPHCLAEEVFNKIVFMKECPYADDIWLKVMELYNKVPTVLSERLFDDPVIEDCLESGLCRTCNANDGNDIQLQQVLSKYNLCLGGGDTLEKRLFSDGKIYTYELDDIMKGDREQTIRNLIDKINLEPEIIIYGAGVVATRLAEMLQGANLLTKIKAFVVLDINCNLEKIKDISIEDYRKYISSTEKILLGVGIAKQEGVYGQLIEAGVGEERIIRLAAGENVALADRDARRLWEGSGQYWENRYLEGKNSGSGSYNHLAIFKAQQINRFVKDNKIITVLEWGCGDGNQLTLAEYPQYIGYDVSPKAIEICKDKFSNDSTKQFLCCSGSDFENDILADMALSLDVLYHLVEDDVFEVYMKRLFSSSKRFVCIYSCDFEEMYALHVRCRKFTDYVTKRFPEWKLVDFVKNAYPYDKEKPDDTSWSDFYFYEKCTDVK